MAVAALRGADSSCRMDLMRAPDASGVQAARTRRVCDRRMAQ